MADISIILLALFVVIAIIFIIFFKIMERRNSARILDTISQVASSQVSAEAEDARLLMNDLPVFNHDVYISYASEDKPIADAMCAKLESDSVRCWIAPRDLFKPTESIPQMMRAIETSAIVVVIFSSHSNNSLHVNKECTRAVDSGKILIPFRIEDTLPSDAMKYLIGTPHWLDAISPPLEDHLSRLSNNIRAYLGRK